MSREGKDSAARVRKSHKAAVYGLWSEEGRHLRLAAENLLPAEKEHDRRGFGNSTSDPNYTLESTLAPYVELRNTCSVTAIHQSIQKLQT